MKEVAIAAQVVKHLRHLRYDVHQEVRGADIVAMMDERAWIIEVKTSLGLGVLSQAWAWVRCGAAHYVSIATPVFRRDPARSVAEWFLRAHGIGWITVHGVDANNATAFWDYPVSEHIRPRVQRHNGRIFKTDIRRSLNDKTRDYELAGTPSPKAWTPFKQTCENVRGALKAGPLTTRELIDAIEHHYRDDQGARATLHSWLRDGYVEGVGRDPTSKRPIRWMLKR